MLYADVLETTTRLLGSKATSLSDVESAGRKQLGENYLGTFTLDQLPLTMPNDSYLIFNADRLIDDDGLPLSGSHWIAIAALEKPGAGKAQQILLGYDSFGRRLTDIHGSDGTPIAEIGLLKRVTMSEDDREQLFSEENCGPRALAFLVVAQLFGYKIARWI